MTHENIAAQVAAEYASAFGYFRLFAPPAGYAWVSDTSELLWFTDDLGPSAEHSASIYLRPAPRDDDDLTQLRVEIRLFWDRAATGGSGLSGRRASLSCTCGGRSMLTEGGGHYQSISMTRVCSAIAGDLVAAIRRHGAGFATT